MKKTTITTIKPFQTIIQPWFIFGTPFFQTLYTRSFKVRFPEPDEIGIEVLS